MTDHAPKRPGNSKSRRSADGHKASGPGYGGPSKPNRILPRTAEGQARGTAAVARMTGDERKARHEHKVARHEAHLDVMDSIASDAADPRCIIAGEKFAQLAGLAASQKVDVAVGAFVIIGVREAETAEQWQIEATADEAA